MARRPNPRQTSLADLLDLTLAPAPVLSPLEALVEAGIIRTVRSLGFGGHIQDPDARFFPRSLCFPVAYDQKWFEPTPRLYLNTPACADSPFVLRVEAVTGLRAVWDPRASQGQWHHAVDLATDADFRRLAASMAHTTVRCVEDAVGLKLTWAFLSPANARSLLAAVGSIEPGDRSAAVWDGVRGSSDGGLGVMPHGAWWAVHGLEDGLFKARHGRTHERLTAAGWARIGRAPPAAKPKRARKAAA